MSKNKKTILGIIIFLLLASAIGLFISPELFQGRIFRSISKNQKDISITNQLIGERYLNIFKDTNRKSLPAYNEKRCYDSDGGQNYEKAGTIYGQFGKSEFGSKSDSCRINQLTEYYCNDNFIQSEKTICENGCTNGACTVKENVSNALDTLVIVDTDYYDLTEEDVEEFFMVAEDFWLKPKTGIGFNLAKIVFVSLNEECPQLDESCYSSEWMIEDFPYFEKNLPEYVVILTEENTSINGGFSLTNYYSWLDPTMGNSYNPDSENAFCTEFPIKNSDYAISRGVVDYKHRYGRCGYDLEKNVISDVSGNGECKNQDGLTCVIKNGYQMCPNLVDDFFAQDLLYFSAGTMVHELLHAYGSNGNLDHFGTAVCNDAMGDKMQELEEKGISEPFGTLAREYASICPTVWEEFKNSQKSCE